MPDWLIWFLVAGNLLNMVFDGTIVVVKLVQWVKRRRYEKRRGIVRRRA